jgi:D-alanyl-D-alanine carboxypeptidase (penicillin-binding protein 5/6)
MSLRQTRYMNPHGLKAGNTSTARDIARLGSYLMSEKEIVNICNAKTYKCTLEGIEFDRQARWQNTNKLLDRGFSGIKTGWTNTAGPCLVVRNNNGPSDVLCVVFACRT